MYTSVHTYTHMYVLLLQNNSKSKQVVTIIETPFVFFPPSQISWREFIFLSAINNAQRLFVEIKCRGEPETQPLASYRTE